MITATSRGQDYHTELSDGKHIFYADTPVADGGSDDYQRPGDILASALAACMNITARKIMNKRGLSYREVKTYVELDRSNPEAITFRRKTVIDADFDESIKNEICEEITHCPVCGILAAEKVFENLD